MRVVNWVLVVSERRDFESFPAEGDDFERGFLLEGLVVEGEEVFLYLGELRLIVSVGDLIDDFGLRNGSESFDAVHDELVGICEVGLGNYRCLGLDWWGFYCWLNLLRLIDICGFSWYLYWRDLNLWWWYRSWRLYPSWFDALNWNWGYLDWLCRYKFQGRLVCGYYSRLDRLDNRLDSRLDRLDNGHWLWHDLNWSYLSIVCFFCLSLTWNHLRKDLLGFSFYRSQPSIDRIIFSCWFNRQWSYLNNLTLVWN